MTLGASRPESAERKLANNKEIEDTAKVIEKYLEALIVERDHEAILNELLHEPKRTRRR